MWDGEYSFFDYKYNIAGYSGQDYDGTGRTVYMLFALISIPILLFLLRRTKRKYADNFIKVLAILMPLLEATKITWESVWDVRTGRGFNWGGLLPIYTCSLFIYCMIGAAFGKGRFKDCCLAWTASIGFVGGMSNVIFIRGLKWYPFFTFGAFYSMFFHYIMVFTALFIVVSHYKSFSFYDIGRAFLVHCAFSAIVIPIDFIKHWDYMQYYEAGGVPVLEDVVEKLANAGLRFLAIPLMLLVYLALAAILVSLYVGYDRLTLRCKTNKR